MQLLFALAIFASALLLFLVEPMVGKMLLPLLGGTPGVWNTCLVFFQAVLLAGYLYSHLSTARLGARRQSILHVVVLALPFLALPIVIPPDLAPTDSSSDQPAGWVLRILVMTVGLPFFVVSTSGSLLQRWFAGTGHRAARDPYFLYAASNFGSLLALLAYPFLVEPLLPLARQSWVWTVGYGAFVLLAVGCAVALWRSRGGEAPAEHAAAAPATTIPLTGARRARWVLLSFVPSSLLMGVTTHLSTDIAAIPLLWVVPLALYLLSFILVFASKPPLPHATMLRLLAPAVVLLAIFLASGASDPIWLVIPLHLVTFFLAAMVCHGELAKDRPAADHLTEFYLWLSVGGVLGGLFNALFAPVAFHYVGLVEYPLALVLACAVRPTLPPGARPNSRDLLLPLSVGLVTVGLLFFVQAVGLEAGPVRTLLSFGIPALAVYTFAERSLRFALGIGVLFVVGGLAILPNPRGKELHFERNFFGFVRVFERPESGEPDNLFHEFVHGTTIHGRQSLTPGRELEPTAYYFRTGPIGDVFRQFDATVKRRQDAGTSNDVCIAGLGAGGLSCYRLGPDRRPKLAGQTWTYYEIDPAVERVARDVRFFTFLRDCFPDGERYCRVDLGDARLRMRDAPDRGFGLIIMDAFSSDSVPVHLLSQEALRLYRQKLARHGILVFNISNRYLNLKPVLAGLAADAGLVYRNRDDLAPVPPEEKRLGKTNSQWVVMAESEADIDQLAHDPRWLPNDGPTTLWTDDFSNLLGLLKWREFTRILPTATSR